MADTVKTKKRHWLTTAWAPIDTPKAAAEAAGTAKWLAAFLVASYVLMALLGAGRNGNGSSIAANLIVAALAAALGVWSWRTKARTAAILIAAWIAVELIAKYATMGSPSGFRPNIGWLAFHYALISAAVLGVRGAYALRNISVMTPRGTTLSNGPRRLNLD